MPHVVLRVQLCECKRPGKAWGLGGAVVQDAGGGMVGAVLMSGG